MIQTIKRLFRPDLYGSWQWLLVFIAFIAVHIPIIKNGIGEVNLAVLLAEAFNNGTFYVDRYYYDIAIFNGQYFVVFPPFPAILLMPFEVVFGAEALNTVLVSVLLTCLNFYLFQKILSRLAIDGESQLWLLLAFFFGTGYWYTIISSHHINGFAHIVCTTTLFLLIGELLGKQRGWLLGLYLGLAFLCRQMTLFYGFFVLFALLDTHWRTVGKGIDFKKLAAFFGTGAVFLIGYLLYNYARFGNPLDSGYSYIDYSGVVATRVANFGVFNPKFLLFNIYTTFIKGHNIEFSNLGLMQVKDVDLVGTSLLSASPFVVAAFKAEWRAWYKWGSWLSIIIILGFTLFYHNNGWEQVNTHRFTLDFMPLLILLVALGRKSIPGWLFRGMIVYAIVLNVLSFAVHAIYQ